MVIVLTILVFLFTLGFIRILKESLIKDYEIEIERCITSNNEEE